MAIQEISAVLVKKASNGDQIWVYPITLSENIIHNDEQLDELITEIVNNITALKSGTVFDTALSATSTKGVQNKTIYTALDNKVDKEDGKGLSTNDYTTADKNKLKNIENNANNYKHPSYTQRSSGLYKITVDATGHVSGVTAVAKSDITALGIPAQDTTYSVATTGSNGLMSSSDKSKLNGIASGAEVNQNAFSNILVGSTTIAADSKTDTLTLAAGNNVTLTPDASGDKITISATNTTYSVATTSSNGLMSAADKKKLDGIAANANNYTHPSYTNKASGLYKITVDALGHVSAATAVAKSDITALGIPAQDTTYSTATTSTSGLMSAADKTKLNGIESGANKTVIDSALNSTSTNPVQNKVINSAINAVNTRLDNIIEGAPDAYDTLKEISDYISSHTTEYEALYALVGDKVTKEDGKGLSTNDYTTTEKNKLAGIATGAEVNQNAFSNISVGSTTIAADSKTDTLTFVAGNNVTLTPDASGDKITFSATNTTYSVATTSSNGLMSAADKTKLNGIAENANNYKHPSYTQKSSGLYKITVDATGHVSAVTAVAKSDITKLGIPAQDTTYSTATESTLGLTKLYSSAGTATDGTMTRTAITNALNGKATIRQLGNNEDLDDITTPGLYSAGGSNEVANKPSDVDAFGLIVYKVASGYIRQDLISGNTNPGKRFTRYYDSTDWTGWMYLPTYASNPTSGEVIIADSNGFIKSSGYTIAKSVPSNAKFTDTTYSTATTSASGLMSAADKKKLDAIDANANNYTHPSYTQRSSGLYKITVDATGHVSAVTAVAKSDITALGIPAQDTTYTLSSFGITASAAELNYVDGVTSNIQTQLNNKLSTTATAAAASKLATARNINGMSFDGTANRFNYGTCSTAAATAAKTVSCTGFTLATGAEITVKFTVTNSASSPTLNVNSTGAKPIYYNGAAISAGYLKAKKTYTFRYNGTQYDLVGDIDTNTTYSLSSFGITATAAELNKLDGLTATTAELNYVDGVTSNIQTQLNSKAASNHSHSNATTSTSGFMSGTDKKKLDGIAANANNYTHPSYTTRSTNMYRFAVDASGHVSTATAVTKANLEDLLGYSIAMDESAPSSVTEETYFFEIEEIETA